MTIKVKKVIDGDTFQDSRNRFYRLADVDAPEKHERGYNGAKVALQNMIGGEELVVKQVGELEKLLLRESLPTHKQVFPTIRWGFFVRTILPAIVDNHTLIW